MRDYIEAIILGIIQGFTEFLPVSSSGHLELAKWLFGDTSTASESFMMTIILHFGTALATLWVFREYIWNVLKNFYKPEGRRYIWMIILSMIPAVIVGVAFESQINEMFERQIILVSIFLCLTGILLLISDRMLSTEKPLTPIRALIMGIVQAIAIIPGLSRSGSTITTGVALGIDRREVAQFSFLMVIPLIFGKIAKDAMDGTIASDSTKPIPLVIGFIFSFIAGVIACKWMVSIVKKAKLSYFGIYCLLIGITAIILRLWVWTT